MTDTQTQALRDAIGAVFTSRIKARLRQADDECNNPFERHAHMAARYEAQRLADAVDGCVEAWAGDMKLAMKAGPDAQALRAALEKLIDVADKSAARAYSDGDRRLHVVDLVTTANDARKALAASQEPTPATPDLRSAAQASVALLVRLRPEDHEYANADGSHDPSQCVLCEIDVSVAAIRAALDATPVER